ncbi:MAG: methylglyoxal synthase [Tissierellia bacterium]|nr:methylglyoxal synthase [Tissierellia bacterium]
MTNLDKKIVNKKKMIALVAHDGLKNQLFKWMDGHKDLWADHDLCGTGTTSSIIREKFKVDIKSYLSGPLGGDQQLGAAIAQGQIDVLIFFWDPLKAQPHDPDVKALLRIAVLYDVPVAMSPSAATVLLSSPFMRKEYTKEVYDSQEEIEDRVEKFI